MSSISHHVIIVTQWNRKRANVARRKAKALGLQVSSIAASVMENYSTFVVFPDGSKDGWEVSDDGDRKRGEFIRWLRSMESEPSYPLYDWCEVEYSGDTETAAVVSHAWDEPAKAEARRRSD